MVGPLAALGLSDDAQLLYTHALRQAPRTVDDHAVQLEWHPERVVGAAQELSERWLAWLADGRVQIAAPRETLEHVLQDEEAALEARREELARAREGIAEFTREYREGERIRSSSGPLWEVLSPEAARGITGHFLRATKGDIRSMAMSADVGPAFDAEVPPALEAVTAENREIRAIYPLSALSTAEARAWVQRWAEAGERHRFADAIPAEFAVFGDEAVITAPRWGDATHEVVVIHEPLIVQAFMTVFDQLWAVSIPSHLGGPGGRRPGAPSRADLVLLELLAKGLKDEAIARHLDVSLRTVRRRIADLMDSLGADSRFQLGVEAQRRGMLGQAR